jgi:ribonuclease BN (tRNA processing enzyme)
MKLTIVGSGDAFGSGGRFNTCFWLETANGTLLVDCGASSLVALKARGLDHARVDGIVLSHLHGDHFGGLPFLLLDAQLPARRERARGSMSRLRPSFRALPGTNGDLPGR